MCGSCDPDKESCYVKELRKWIKEYRGNRGNRGNVIMRGNRKLIYWTKNDSTKSKNITKCKENKKVGDSSGVSN